MNLHLSEMHAFVGSPPMGESEGLTKAEKNKFLIYPLDPENSCNGCKIIIITAVLFLLVASELVAGNTIPDTITVNTVTVTAISHTRELPFSTFIIDSSLIVSERGSDMGSLLQYSSPVVLKKTGTDGVSSLSIRGMSGSHTSVIWNGLEINAPLNGQTDFKLLPVFAFDQVQIKPGGANLSEISGSIGGTVLVSSGEKTEDGTAFKCFIGGGSYGKNNAGISFSTGNGKIECQTRLWLGNAQNNFPFVNENAPGGPETLRRVNASSHMRGAMEELSISGRRQHLSLHMWFSDTDRQLPSAVTTVQQNLGEKQQDKSLRTVLNYKYLGDRVKTEVVSGYINEINIYDYKLAGIHGDNRSETFTMRSSFRLQQTGRFRLSFNAGDILQKATSLSYDNTHFRNMLSTSAVSDIYISNRLLLQAQLRATFVSGDKPAPEFTIGASFKTDKAGENILKANFSRNIKYPSLNDLYWSPGGNTGLKPELSTGGEISFNHSGDRRNPVYSDYSVALFDARVTDLIQWAPGKYTYWEAQNLKSVNTGGAELSATTFYNPGLVRLKMMTSYAFTRSVITDSDVANDASVGKQLIYTPYHVINAVLTGEYGIFRLQPSLLFNSRRYTVSDDSGYLKGYIISNLSAGMVLKSKKTIFNIDISVDNLFNAAYESTKGYPMPLRTFTIDLLLTLNPKSDK